MKKVFIIEWPDNCGPEWINRDKVEECLVLDPLIQAEPILAIDITKRVKKEHPHLLEGE